LNAWFASVQQKFINDFFVQERWRYIVSGLRITILVTILALLMGLVLGVVVGMVRSTHDQSNPSWTKSPGSFLLKLANAICKLYVTVIRGTPTLVQLLIMNFIILVTSPKITVAVLTFGVNSGAYIAEIIRGGIMGVDKGQMEAGRSLGLSYVTTMKDIILPQAMKSALPALINEMITLLKETSICGYIGLNELTRGGDIIRGVTFDALFPLFTVAIIYLAMVLLIEWLMGKVERRLRSSDYR
jgi:ABC-type amino acid transport system permease subunit